MPLLLRAAVPVVASADVVAAIAASSAGVVGAVAAAVAGTVVVVGAVVLTAPPY